MDKQISIIYFSATDTTSKVVKSVADSIGGSINEYNMTLSVNRGINIDFTPDDIVVVGIPVYGGRVPDFLTDSFKKIKGNDTPAIFIVVYGNRAYEDSLLELKNTFEENGFIGIAAGAFIGEHSNTGKVGTGRPDNKDLQIARSFGEEIKEKLKSVENTGDAGQLTVKGNFPYKERMIAHPISPSTYETCISCGICAKHCPMGAIDFNNFREIDSEKCIGCSSCVKRCPKNAKEITHEAFKKITQMLIDNCSIVRQEPELFI